MQAAIAALQPGNAEPGSAAAEVMALVATGSHSIDFDRFLAFFSMVSSPLPFAPGRPRPGNASMRLSPAHMPVDCQARGRSKGAVEMNFTASSLSKPSFSWTFDAYI